MKQLCYLLAILGMTISCQKDYDHIKTPDQLLPESTNTIILINELNDFISSGETHTILSEVYGEGIQKASVVLKNLNTTNKIYLAFLNESDRDYLLLSENDSLLFSVDSLPNHISEKITNIDVDKIQIDSSTIYTKTYGNVFTASNNIDIIKNLNIKNNQWEHLISTTNNTSVASLIFKSKDPNYSKLFWLKGFNDTHSVIDLNYSENNLQYNGIITPKDSSKTKLDCFKNTIPQELQNIHVVPSTVKSVFSIAFDDYSIFNKNLHQYRSNAIDSTQTFLNFTNEIAQTDNSIVIHALDIDLVIESIENKSYVETYRDINIYRFENPDFFKERLKPFISFENASYLSRYKNFILFSDSPETIKSILASALNGNVLANSAHYKSISDQLSHQTSIFIYKNAEEISKLFNRNIKDYNANAVQLIYEDNYAHVNGIIQKFNQRKSSKSVVESFSTPIEAVIISPPQTVKNHITKAHDIVVQDVNNVLYLISSSGTILWKKQLQGKILGKIEQIDMYKNGRLQLAFATPNRLYVLDRNGNDVSPFPLKFNDNITQPLSVFDYDKRKNYRLLVTQGPNLLMYDAKGKRVNGFNYSNNGFDIKTQPKHFRIGSKDYIAFVAGNYLKILNRQGNVRIDVKDKIRYSDNDLYLFQNKFTSTNTLGELVQVDTKGKLTKKNLNLTDKHIVTTTSKTLVSMTDNKLNIKSRTIDLDYGDYTDPRIFYLNDKIYVSTTDLQTKKVYLFDSQAKSIANFPIFGSASAELQKLDTDKALEIITQADDKTIVVYKLY